MEQLTCSIPLLAARARKESAYLGHGTVGRKWFMRRVKGGLLAKARHPDIVDCASPSRTHAHTYTQLAFIEAKSTFLPPIGSKFGFKVI